MNVVSIDSFIKTYIYKHLSDIENIDQFDITFRLKEDIIQIFICNRNTNKISFSTAMITLFFGYETFKDILTELVEENMKEEIYQNED